jgi:hypothetical protein
MRGSASHDLARAAVVLLFLTVAACASHTPTPTPAAPPTSVPGRATTAAPVPVAAWTRQFGSPQWDRGNGIAVDASGNVIVAGATQGTLPGQTSAGNWDMFARKFSPAGAEVWTRQFGSSALDWAFGVAADGSGNIIVAGATLGALPGQVPAGNWDIFARKFSPEGTELWTIQSGSSGSDDALALAVDASGNTILAGHTDGTLPGQTSAGYEDAYVRKLSPAGTELWTSQFGSPESDWASGVAVDASGNIIVAGHTDGTLPGQTSAGGEDAFVRKLSPAGVELWTIQFGSPALDRAWGVAVDVSGNIILAGHTDGTLPGQANAGGGDAFVQKLSPAGAELWTSQFGSLHEDRANGVAVDASGNIFVAGYTTGTLPGQTRAGFWDAFVRKLSPEGTELWTHQFGSSLSDEAFGTAVDRSGNAFVAGNTEDTLPGQTRAGFWDVFVIRLNQPSASQPDG